MIEDNEDDQNVSPNGSQVGFAAANVMFHDTTGVHMGLYTITDWLGLVPVAFGLGFAVLGLSQWFDRKSLLKVNCSILALGRFYLIALKAWSSTNALCLSKAFWRLLILPRPPCWCCVSCPQPKCSLMVASKTWL